MIAVSVRYSYYRYIDYRCVWVCLCRTNAYYINKYMTIEFLRIFTKYTPYLKYNFL